MNGEKNTRKDKSTWIQPFKIQIVVLWNSVFAKSLYVFYLVFKAAELIILNSYNKAAN